MAFLVSSCADEHGNVSVRRASPTTVGTTSINLDRSSSTNSVHVPKSHGIKLFAHTTCLVLAQKRSVRARTPLVSLTAAPSLPVLHCHAGPTWKSISCILIRSDFQRLSVFHGRIGGTKRANAVLNGRRPQTERCLSLLSAVRPDLPAAADLIDSGSITAHNALLHNALLWYA